MMGTHSIALVLILEHETYPIVSSQFVGSIYTVLEKGLRNESDVIG